MNYQEVMEKYESPRIKHLKLKKENMTTSRNKTKKKSDLHTSTCLAKNTKISIDNNEINEMYYTHHSAPIGCAHTRVWVQID